MVEEVPYPDHHPYKERDLAWLDELAGERGADLVTTSKDHVRLPESFRARTGELPIRLLFDDPDEVAAFVVQGLRERLAAR